MMTCDYKELAPFSSSSLSVDQLVRCVSVDSIYLWATVCSIVATVNGKICCECFIKNVFLDAKEKEV